MTEKTETNNSVGSDQKNAPVHVDGSRGEGGGQILRSSLALSIITGRPLRIENIRAGRQKPGLMRQHLTALRAAAEISGARISGDEIGSMTLNFEPETILPGEYHFAVGTAGSAGLVFQTILPPLLWADAPSRLILEGGTHNAFAPPFDFLKNTFLPRLAEMGANVNIELERPGFYPAGGGRFTADIQPFSHNTTTTNERPIEFLERGALLERKARILHSQIPEHVARRERDVILDKMRWPEEAVQIETVTNSRGPGNVILIELFFENILKIFSAYGQTGVKAEQVALAAIKDARAYLKSQALAGEYLTDQLLLPLALFGGGRFSASKLSRHTMTNIDIIQMFLDLEISTEQNETGDWLISINART